MSAPLKAPLIWDALTPVDTAVVSGLRRHDDDVIHHNAINPKISVRRGKARDDRMITQLVDSQEFL